MLAARMPRGGPCGRQLRERRCTSSALCEPKQKHTNLIRGNRTTTAVVKATASMGKQPMTPNGSLCRVDLRGLNKFARMQLVPLFQRHRPCPCWRRLGYAYRAMLRHRKPHRRGKRRHSLHHQDYLRQSRTSRHRINPQEGRITHDHERPRTITYDHERSRTITNGHDHERSRSRTTTNDHDHE